MESIVKAYPRLREYPELTSVLMNMMDQEVQANGVMKCYEISRYALGDELSDSELKALFETCVDRAEPETLAEFYQGFKDIKDDNFSNVMFFYYIFEKSINAAPVATLNEFRESAYAAVASDICEAVERLNAYANNAGTNDLDPSEVLQFFGNIVDLAAPASSLTIAELFDLNNISAENTDDTKVLYFANRFVENLNKALMSEEQKRKRYDELSAYLDCQYGIVPAEHLDFPKLSEAWGSVAGNIKEQGRPLSTSSSPPVKGPEGGPQ